MAIELGTAYIQIQPSTKGLIPQIKGTLDKELPGPATKAGEVMGEKMGDGTQKGLKGKLPKIGNMMKGALVGVAVAAGAAVVKGFTDSVDAASSLEQSRGGLAAIFGEDVALMEKHAKDAAKTRGLSEDQYNQSATKIGAILKGQGLDYVEWTDTLLTRGADMAATFGSTTTEATDAINAGIRGEYEQLEKYGVSIKESTVNMELVKRGQDKLTGADLERAKGQARLDLIMQSTMATEGQFAAEADTHAGKQERLAAQFENVKAAIGEKLLPVMSGAMDFIGNKVIPGVEGMISAWENSEGVMGDVRTFIENVLVPAFKFVGDFLKDYVAPAIKWVFEEVVGPTLRGISDAVSNFGQNWERIWQGLKAAAAAPINFVIRTVWNNGLRKVLNMIPGVNVGDPLPVIQVPPATGRRTARGNIGGLHTASAFARGGILPGFSRASDGDDQLIMARRGEGITVSEALDDFERNRLLALNEAALRGISAQQFRERYDGHYATGGIVGFRGHRFTDTFVAALRAAEALAATTFRITQGGFRPRTSYSGTSHQGDAVDIASPITTAVIKALRASGVAAWDRTGKGNWMPHIHGVPLPGYGRAAGSAIWQAQDYLRGGDGLGGRDNGPYVAAGRAGGGNLLTEIPKMWKSINASVTELNGPWGSLFKSGIKDGLSKAWEFILDKVPFLDKIVSFGGAIISKFEDFTSRGYASGTSSALRGPAWVGENGPEIVDFRGGERVYTAAQSAAMTAPVHIENVNLPGIKTFRELMEFVEELPHTRRHGHMMGV